MATRGVAFTATFMALDSATGRPKTGDSANITPRLCKDGTGAALTTTTVTEVDATNLKGLYKVSISATEADCNELVVGGVSATSGIDVVPTTYQMERLPDAAPDAAGGVRDVARVAGTAQTARDLGATLGAAGAGLTAIPDLAGVTTLLTRLSAARAGYLDNLSAGAVALASALVTAQNDLTTLVGRILGTLAAGTHNAQSGDAFARLGAAGASLTALGDARLANLDAAITTRTKPADTQAAVTTVGSVTGSVGSVASFGTLVADIVAAVWGAATSGLTAAGSIGKKLADWAIHSAADVWAVATRVLTANTNLSIPTAADNADAVWDEAIAGHAGAGSTGAALAAATAPTAGAVADAVWDELTAGHAIAGSTGAALAAAGGAADPLLNAVPGTYASGTAGAALGRIGSAAITVTSPVSQDGETVEIISGDDYLNANGRALTFTRDSATTEWPDLTGATVTLRFTPPGTTTVSLACVVTTPTGSGQAFRCDVARTVTESLEGSYKFDVQAALVTSGNVVTLLQGDLVVRPDV